MDDEALRDVRAALEARRDEANALAASATDALAQLAGARDAAQADDEHDPEGATLSVEWSRLAALQHAADVDRVQIEQALARSSSPEFGICVGCGVPIPVERLLVRPEATMCVPCATAAASGRGF